MYVSSNANKHIHKKKIKMQMYFSKNENSDEVTLSTYY